MKKVGRPPESLWFIFWAPWVFVPAHPFNSCGISLKIKCQPPGSTSIKSQSATKPNHLGTKNICSKCYTNPSNSRWDVSVRTKAADQWGDAANWRAWQLPSYLSHLSVTYEWRMSHLLALRKVPANIIQAAIMFPPKCVWQSNLAR